MVELDFQNRFFIRHRNDFIPFRDGQKEEFAFLARVVWRTQPINGNHLNVRVELGNWNLL